MEPGIERITLFDLCLRQFTDAEGVRFALFADADAQAFDSVH